MAAITVPLAALSPDATNVTYPDSFIALGLAPSFGLPHVPKPYHGEVFRLSDLSSLNAGHGLPNAAGDRLYAT